MFSVEIKDKVAWVTGASRGIGREIAIGLAKAGCNIAVGYRSGEAEASKVVEEVVALGQKAIAVKLDVAVAAECEAAHEKIAAEFDGVDILVNNAGVTADNLFMGLEEEDWKKVLDVNVMGAVNATKMVVRDMMMKRCGRIINMSSIAGTKAGRGQSNYAATKGAIEAMSRSLATELGTKGITVNCVAPGVIETDMSAEVVKLGKDEIFSRLIVKRLGTPEEIAAWVVFLASDYGSFITGQTIHIDGGMKMV